MAGGKGERLRPLTEKTPKPLIKVGDKCIIDYNIDRLLSYGLNHISVTVNYLGDQIEEHFREERDGVKIVTVREPKYLGTIEINVRARYYFGLSDVVRNRNKYADNGIDGSENPFWTTPMRSPLDNLTISVGLSYRFNKEGFSTWKPRPKREKNREVFKYGL